MLLSSGCSVNAADYDKRTCLHLASSEGNYAIAKHLIETGAVVNAKDRWGGTPLDDARLEGHDAVALFLEQSGAHAGPGGRRTKLGMEELLSIELQEKLGGLQQSQQSHGQSNQA